MKTVVWPNFDTLYSLAWFEPHERAYDRIGAEYGRARYYLLPMLEMWTDVFASPGWRTTEAQTFLVTSPGWTGTVPDGVAQLKASTPYVWIGRIKTDGPADYDAVHKIRAGLKLMPLADGQ
jgi:hypothetical protein